MPEPTITHLERRKIEGGVLIPMVQAFQRAIGKERANEIAREVIISSPGETASDGLSSLARILRRWNRCPASGRAEAATNPATRKVEGNA